MRVPSHHSTKSAQNYIPCTNWIWNPIAFCCLYQHHGIHLLGTSEQIAEKCSFARQRSRNKRIRLNVSILNWNRTPNEGKKKHTATHKIEILYVNEMILYSCLKYLMRLNIYVYCICMHAYQRRFRLLLLLFSLVQNWNSAASSVNIFINVQF